MLIVGKSSKLTKSTLRDFFTNYLLLKALKLTRSSVIRRSHEFAKSLVIRIP